jgi:glycine betaine/proline transport system substrate-binding protein
MIKFRTALTALAVVFTLSTTAQADEAACGPVRLSDIGWTDITATTALTSLVLKGLGYAPDIKVLSIPVTFTSMKRGDIDVFLGDWEPSLAADRQPYLDDASVEVLGVNLAGAKYTLAVPAYLAAAGLKDFADIAKFRKDLDGKIYGIEPGNDGNRIIQSLIDGKELGLGDFQLVESSEQGMLAEVARDYPKQKAIVFLGWAPHPMNTQFDMVYLSGGDKWFGPDYGGANVHTDVRAGLTKTCPNLGTFLTQLKFSLPMEGEIMGDILNLGTEPAVAAKTWLAAHPEVLAPWLAGVTTLDGQDGLAAVQAALAK